MRLLHKWSNIILNTPAVSIPAKPCINTCHNTTIYNSIAEKKKLHSMAAMILFTFEYIFLTQP